MQFLDPKTDDVAGIIVQWNCHPETLDSKNTLISADFVGAAVKHLESRYRCPVVYLTGTVGGLLPTGTNCSAGGSGSLLGGVTVKGSC